MTSPRRGGVRGDPPFFCRVLRHFHPGHNGEPQNPFDFMGK